MKTINSYAKSVSLSKTSKTVTLWDVAIFFAKTA